jgi:hypothetical protein
VKPHDWDVPLFEVPAKYRPPARVIKYPQWRKYVGKRTSCDDCVMALADGTSHFMAEPARYIRIDAAGRRYYCAQHTQDRKWKDSGR